tara:strand:+ start:41 stop:1225 length:1185 start_codon:yes stop_codon:yes gene_type:complete
MLPINKKNGPCDPISSNCVVWQGPDLDCVDICNGDSISSVIAGLCETLILLQSSSGSGGGSHSINLSTINQTTLSGGPATTTNELIQLIIDNINSGGNSGSGGKIWDCTDTLDCTLAIPSCYDSSSGVSLVNPGTLSVIITDLMNHHCSSNHQQAAMVSSIQSINDQVIQLKKIPTGDPNPTLQSVCVDTVNTNPQPLANLVNKIEVDYCKTKSNLGTTEQVVAALSKQPINPMPLDSAVFGGGTFVPSIPNNPTSIAESFNACWRLINDLRAAVTTLQTSSGNNGILKRMVDINTFYAVGASCGQAISNAVTGGDYCVDLWNSSGINLDTNVRAYNQPSGEATYELATGTWHAVCPGTTDVAQYLGGYSGTKSPPFWSARTVGCTGSGGGSEG